MFELRFFEIYRSEEYLLLLLEGIGVSTSLTIGAGVMGFLLAFILAALNYWRVPILGLLAACYIDFIRNTPLIVQLFFFAFGLPGLIGLCLAVLVSRLFGIDDKFFWLFCRNS